MAGSLSASVDSLLSGTPGSAAAETLNGARLRGKIYNARACAKTTLLRGLAAKDAAEGTICCRTSAWVQAPNCETNIREEMPAGPTSTSSEKAAAARGSVSNVRARTAWDIGGCCWQGRCDRAQSAHSRHEEFRAALWRDALEGVKNAGRAHGISNMSANDQPGLDQRAAVMVQIKDGAWQLAK